MSLAINMAPTPPLHNFHVYFGPPGSGKTTTLGALARRYAEEEGPDTLMLCSLTRTAARELAGRDLPVPAQAIGTIHSHCYHALDKPAIAETHYQAWNSAYPYLQLAAPQHAISTAPDERRQQRLPGETLLASYSLLRACLRPVPTGKVSLFAAIWERWKQACGYRDFTDLLTDGLALLPVAPRRPQTILIDEAQDLTPLQWAIIAQWSHHARRTIAVGDDDQALYKWCGADATPLLTAPEANKTILPHSYRLPRAIYTHSLTYLAKIRTRQPKVWEPRASVGICRHVGAHWKHPDTFLTRVLDAASEPWGTCAIITTCGYMLAPCLAELRKRGLPFGNPWRESRRDWNPLLPPQRGIGAVTRALDFLRPVARLWTWRELASWLAILRVDGHLFPDAKARVTRYATLDHPCTLDDLRTIFLPEALPGAMSGSTAWLAPRVLAQHAASMAYPLRVSQRHGREALTAPPRLFVGTAHSFKGAEADQVLLFPHLSRAATMARIWGGAPADDVQRTLYVGATRAKECLYFA